MFNLLHSKHYFIFIEGGAVLWAILIKMRRSQVILLVVRTRLWWKALWPGCLHWQHSSWLVLMLHQYSSSQRLEGKMLDLPGVATSKSFVYFWQSCSTLKKLQAFKVYSTQQWTFLGYLNLRNVIGLTWGLTREEGSLLLTSVGVTNLLGQVLIGKISDKDLISGITTFALGCLGSTACCMSYPFANSFWLMSTLSAVHGLMMASYMTVLPLVALELFGVSRVTVVFGIFIFFLGIGALSGPPVISHLFEVLDHNYILTMSVIASLYLVALILALVCKHLRKRLQDLPPIEPRSELLDARRHSRYFENQ